MIMALVEDVKKGGRYTQKEREERRFLVYQLHFNKSESAIEIAELLNVNRNTVNEDIKLWYIGYGKKPNDQDYDFKLDKQIKRKEIQRDRLLDYLEESETLEEKIKIEKFIFDLDNKLDQWFSKMVSHDLRSRCGF